MKNQQSLRPGTEISFSAMLLLLTLILSSLPFSRTARAQNPARHPQLVDAEAHRRVRALYANLKEISGQSILFGHQDALAYGIGWKEANGRSDVKDVCGAHPAVFGWDAGKLGQSAFNIDTVFFGKMQQWIIDAYKMGAVNTISWHMDNPVNGGSSWDTTPAVAAILPGGPKHEAYLAQLDHFAAFAHSLRAGFPLRKPVPLIFRPFHEHTGSWFWWGKGNCSAEEYKQLWRFTVEYLRDAKGLKNLLYAYSTDVVDSPEQYLEFYPGDEYVDILGIDNYRDVGLNGKPDSLTRRLDIVARLAAEKGKVAALTETGYERIPDPLWWTEALLKPIKAGNDASKIAYLLVWRNAHIGHHYAPYPGHPSTANFLAFRADPAVKFQDNMPDVYRFPKRNNATKKK